MIALLLVLLLPARAEILFEGDPTVGEGVVITVVDDLSRPVRGATVRAIHRAGLPGERDLAIGLTDARGRVTWTPEQAGTTVVRTRRDQALTHVRRDGPPISTLVLLGVLGVLGLGATGWGLWPSRTDDEG